MIKKPFLILLAVNIVLLASLVVWRIAIKNRSARPASIRSQLQTFGLVEDFSFKDREGKEFTRSRLQNKIWVASFLDTSCADVCPIVSSAAVRLQKAYSQENLVFITFSVDPEKETPEKWENHINQYGGNPNRWIVLTGQRKKLHRFLRSNFILAAQGRSRKKSSRSFLHSSIVVLVDGDHRIRGYYDVSNEKALYSLKKDLKGLLKKSKK